MYCSRGRDRRLVEEGKVGTSKGPMEMWRYLAQKRPDVSGVSRGEGREVSLGLTGGGGGGGGGGGVDEERVEERKLLV